MLQAFIIVMTAMLGTMHPQMANISCFVTDYVNHENFYIGCLQRYDLNMGPAHLLCYVQLAIAFGSKTCFWQTTRLMQHWFLCQIIPPSCRR